MSGSYLAELLDGPAISPPMPGSDFPTPAERVLQQYLRSAGPNGWHGLAMQRRQELVPLAIRALECDEAFERPPAYQQKNDNPAERLALLLPWGTDGELKPVLSKWVSSGDRDAMRLFGEALVAFGSDDVVPLAKTLFEHSDSVISSGAREAVLKLLQKKRQLEPAFRDYIWEHCLDLLRGEVAADAYDPVRVLKAMDPGRMVESLQDPRILHTSNPMLAAVLGALRSAHRPASPVFLLEVLEHPQEGSANRQEEIRRVAISSLVEQRHPDSGPYLEEVVASPEKWDGRVVALAWYQRFILKGWGEPMADKVFDEYEAAGDSAAALTGPARLLILVHLIDMAVEHGAILNWYLDRSEEDIQDTLKALNELGARKRLKSLELTLRELRRQSPLRSIDDFPEWDSSFSEATDDALTELCSVWECFSWQLLAREWEWRLRTEGRWP